MLYHAFTFLLIVLLNNVFFTWSMEEKIPQLDKDSKTTFFKEQTVTDESIFFQLEEDQSTYIIYTDNGSNVTITTVNTKEEAPPRSYICPNVSHEIQKISQYATYAQQKGNDYNFYVAYQDNTVHMITFRIISPTECQLSSDYLHKHNSPIAHMSLLKSNNQSYLVSGSLYPSIKLCNLQDYKIVKTVHNCFLFGCIDNIIIYAKKNNIPKTGLGRFIESRNHEKTHPCSIYYLQDPFDTKEIMIKNNVTIKPNSYPIISEYNSSLNIVDPNTQTVDIIQKKSDNTINLSTINQQNYTINKQKIVTKIERVEKDNLTFADAESATGHLTKLFSSAQFYNYFENGKRKHDTRIVIKKMLTDITGIPEKNIKDGPITMIQMLSNQGTEIYKNKFVLSTIANLCLNQKTQKITLPKIIFTTSIEKSKINLNTLKNISRVYSLKNQTIFAIQQKNDLFYKHFNNPNKNFDQLPLLLNYQENILHIFDNEIATNQRLIHWDLPSDQSQEGHIG